MGGGGGGTRECAHKIRRMYDMSVHIKLGACTTWGERECAHQIRSMYNMGGGGGRESAHRESAHTKLGECTT